MRSKRFVLVIHLSNDPMNYQGIGKTLRQVATEIDDWNDPKIGDANAIRNLSGNRVGGWHVDDE